MEGTTSERTSGNIFIRECRLQRSGDVISAHVHKYDHTMFFMRGKAVVATIAIGGSRSERTVEAPCDLLVEKNIKHEITAVTDDVLFSCVFPHRDFSGQVVSEPADPTAYW